MCYIFLYILDFVHTVDITASKHKLKSYDSSTFTLTCNVLCEWPVRVKWDYPNGDRVMSTSTITVLKRIHLLNTTISIIFEPILTSHEGKYTCVSSVQNDMDEKFLRNQEYSLNVRGEAMQISISFSFNLFLKRMYKCVKSLFNYFCHYKK